MSSISSIGSAAASSYAVAQSAATKPQPQAPHAEYSSRNIKCRHDADGDGDHDSGGIDISV